MTGKRGMAGTSSTHSRTTGGVLCDYAKANTYQLDQKITKRVFIHLFFSLDLHPAHQLLHISTSIHGLLENLKPIVVRLIFGAGHYYNISTVSGWFSFSLNLPTFLSRQIGLPGQEEQRIKTSCPARFGWMVMPSGLRQRWQG